MLEIDSEETNIPLVNILRAVHAPSPIQSSPFRSGESGPVQSSESGPVQSSESSPVH